MLKKHLKFNALFALIFLLQLLAEFNHFERLRATTRPMIVLSLMVMLVVGTKLRGRFHKRLFAGQLFALGGDLLLLRTSPDTTYFSYGLFAFLVCHLFYTSAFYLDFRSAPELDKKGARIAILLCAIISISFYFYIRPHLGPMRLPVLAYLLVISLMAMMSAFRHQRVNRSSFILILSGAISFLLSDAVLALHIFVGPFEHAPLLTVAAYMIAQYFITMGAVERKLVLKG